MKLRIELPRSLFKVPQLSANLSVSDNESRTLVIDEQAMATALKEHFGASVSVTVQNAGGE